MERKAPRIVLVGLNPSEDKGTLPLGVGCVAAALLSARRARREDIFIVTGCTDEGEDELLRKIADRKPRLVGFSLYCWNSTLSIALATRLKAEYPNMTLVAGGPDAERLTGAGRPDEAGAIQPFDAVFLGEAELSFPEWLAERGGSPPGDRKPRIIRGRPCDAAALASPWLEGVLEPVRGGAVAWELTRGCPYRCSYCYEGRGASGLRHIPAERLAAELELFVRSGVGEVFVLDPTFNVGRKRALELLEFLSEKGGDISWNFEIRAELLDRSLAKAFARLPCSLQIGLQSARAEVLRKVGRDIDRKKFASKVGLLGEEGVVFGFDLIYGLPGDSLKGFRESLDFALSLSPNHLDIFPLAVLPGTALFGQSDALELDFDYDPPYLLRGHPAFPPGDMRAAAGLARACRIFYSEGRAVPWFLAVLRPLRMSSSAFLADFKSPEDETKAGHKDIEVLQCAHISSLYSMRGKEALLPAALDLVRYYGAWSRAFAEGTVSGLELSYPLESVENGEILDLEYFCARARKRPCLVEIRPGENGPTAKNLGKRA